MPGSVQPVTKTGLSVVPGQTTNYRCNDSTLVFTSSKFFALPCGTNGSFVQPASWPACRQPANCTPPTAPLLTKLLLSPLSPSPLKEFDSAIYGCKTGYTLAGITPNNMTFEPVCPLGGGTFTVAFWPNCTSTAALGRKKRYVTYNNIFSDIDYSVYAFFETQFMHTK